MERRLRQHFFFHDMQQQIKDYIDKCTDCFLFSDKKTQEPMIAHAVPTKCWDSVAVDLFGPLPNWNHVVVVQDLGSRYPVARLVSSTSANKVLPAMTEIYNEYGNLVSKL